jgi:hypothetical protein
MITTPVNSHTPDQHLRPTILIEPTDGTPPDELITRPPYSDPHHSVSAASIIGGGLPMAPKGPDLAYVQPRAEKWCRMAANRLRHPLSPNPRSIMPDGQAAAADSLCRTADRDSVSSTRPVHLCGSARVYQSVTEEGCVGCVAVATGALVLRGEWLPIRWARQRSRCPIQRRRHRSWTPTWMLLASTPAPVVGAGAPS